MREIYLVHEEDKKLVTQFSVSRNRFTNYFLIYIEKDISGYIKNKKHSKYIFYDQVPFTENLRCGET